MHFNLERGWFLFIILGGFLIYIFILPFYHKMSLQRRSREAYARIRTSPVPWKVFGLSEEKRSVYYWQLGDTSNVTLIFGAFHGDEQTGFHLVLQLADSLAAHPESISKGVVLVPVANPDGLLAGTRVNSRGVDINRNFPTDNWTPVYSKDNNYPGPEAASEQETILIMQMLDRFKPKRIITIHDALHMNNFNGPAQELAELLQSYNGYPVTKDVGYPTPGSFGNYTGEERQIPVVTLELPAIGPEEAWEENSQALIAAINF